jgi:uncharacterized protein (DUF1800 family)
MRNGILKRGASATLCIALNLSAVASAQPSATTPKVSVTAASRFLEQAGFGPSAASVAEVQALGFSDWIDAQIALPQASWSVIPNYSTDAKGNTSLAPTQAGFYMNAVSGDDQLRQKVAFALSQIWVVSGVKLQAQAMVPYLQLLQSDAFATYDKIMYDITLSPGMGHYLDMVNNNKETPGHSPDENYAREVMQLFTIGLSQLDQYGRLVLDANGNPIPTYTNDTVRGFATAFTGWTYAPAAGAKSRFGNPANWGAPIVPFESNHDMYPKALLNGYVSPANQTAEQDLADALNNIFTHPNVAPFISRQLIQHLVTSSPSDDYVKRIVDVFNQTPRGSMAAVVKAILLDPEARQGDDGTANAATKLREPALWVPALLRGLNANVAATNNLTNSVGVLGQTIYYSPSVFNYFAPGYQINLSSTQSYNAPEFQLLDEATAMSAADLVNTLSYGTVAGVTIDLSPYMALVGTKPTASGVSNMIEKLNNDLLGGTLSDVDRNLILTTVGSSASAKAIVQGAIYIIASSWNFQVQR